jgi:predicted ABC-type ATPase
MSTVYLIVGPIGGGKSAVADFILADGALKTLEYVGSDVYKSAFFNSHTNNTERSYRCADDLAFYRIEQICKTGQDFMYEFCPTNPNKLETLKYLLRKYSYRVISFFVSTENEEINLVRCANRAQHGADGVPAEKIRNRYGQALSRALELTQFSNTIYFVDNSRDTPRLVACITDDALSVADDACDWFEKHVKHKLAYHD